MAALAQDEDSDDTMDEFMEKFKTQKYKNAFNESNWEEVRTVTLVNCTGYNMSLLLNTNMTLLKFKQCATTLHLTVTACYYI